MARGTTARGIEGLGNVARIVGMAIVAVLVLHVALTVLEANPQNGLTAFVADAADTVDLGLNNLFTPEEPKLMVALNYGTAALIWFAITTVVVRLIRRLG